MPRILPSDGQLLLWVITPTGAPDLSWSDPGKLGDLFGRKPFLLAA